VRELDNVIQRALILHSNNLIDATDILIEHFDTAILPVEPSTDMTEDKLGSELKLQEHQIILDTLQACHGSRKDVAERLGISPRTLRYKMAKMRDSGIQIPA
jgi:two-component system response regulator FlrC